MSLSHPLSERCVVFVLHLPTRCPQTIPPHVTLMVRSPATRNPCFHNLLPRESALEQQSNPQLTTCGLVPGQCTPRLQLLTYGVKSVPGTQHKIRPAITSSPHLRVLVPILPTSFPDLSLPVYMFLCSLVSLVLCDMTLCSCESLWFSRCLWFFSASSWNCGFMSFFY